MSWFRVDDGFTRHRKVLSIPRTKRRNALALWLQGGVWCAQQLSDGLVPFYMLDELDPNPDNQETADALINAGLWEVAPTGWRFHDWADYNAREERAPIPLTVRLAVYARDGWRCVTCGADGDLTLDHIYPWSLGGPDTEQNLQTMCRSCNSRKGVTVQ